MPDKLTVPEDCHCHETQDLTPPTVEDLENLADFFKIFGDKTRLRILYLLETQELCVTHLAEALEMTSPAVSHQLRMLKTQRLIKSRREGKEMIYSLSDHHIKGILDQGLVHIHEIFS